MGRYGCIAATFCLVSWLVSAVSAEPVYDVDGDGKEGLVEAVHALQVASGLTPPLTLATYSNSIGMQFRLLPAGTFTMGSPASEPGRFSFETQHQVTLTKPFYMQITEVTNGQWDAVITDKGRGYNPSGSHTGDNYPVESVTWYEAANFANWLSFDEGLTSCYNGNGTCSGTLGDDFTCTSVTISSTCTGYRLPTEAQWEYAARAATATAYANPVYFDHSDTETGGGFNGNLHAMGWYSYNDAMENSSAVTAYESGTKPVAAKQANYWGLYDMHGNVWEWCRDWWDASAYSSDPVIDPTGDATGTHRVVRSGGWYGAARIARSGGRSLTTPGTSSNALGFRLTLPPDQ